ncbi:hypothetical protein SADUNF_Sadunf01G0141700 [Salix dunnii]|uniref:Uncharacterized protein n=1 Tax=Salix dunnii TaxID=1413687 RepID=A0A835TNK8_9ROSI|nr:hypothetical protein SADUNF_Sadunf01G0141700 [Salix dunnii]
MSIPLEVKFKIDVDTTPIGLFNTSLSRDQIYLTMSTMFHNSFTILHSLILKNVQRILQYLKGIIDTSLHPSSNTTLDLYVFFDADWVGNPAIRRST